MHAKTRFEASFLQAMVVTELVFEEEEVEWVCSLDDMAALVLNLRP